MRVRGRSARFEWAHHGAVIVMAAWCALGVLLVLDAVLRRPSLERGVAAHLLVAGATYAAYAGVVGLVVALAVAGERTLTRRTRGWLPGLARFVGPLWYGTLGAAACAPTASYLFSGRAVAESSAARWGPPLVTVVAGLAVALGAKIFEWLLRRRERRGRAQRAAAALGAVVGAGAAAYVDQTFFVALYTRLHAALEAVTVLLLGAAAFVVLTAWAKRWPSVRRLYGVVATLSVVWGLTGLVSARPRSWAREHLAHAARQPVYVDRLLTRLQDLDGALAGIEEGDEKRRLVRQIMSRYDIASAALDTRWAQPPDPPEWRAAWEALGVPLAPDGYHLLVYYVDTLRYDAAHDPTIMPNLVGLAARSLDFRSAYSSASDTIEAMPALMSGRYKPSPEDEDLLTVAREARVPSAVVLPLSARRFLGKHAPRFRFDEMIDIRDYEQGKRVWGYGADQPTAPRIVDAALEWLGARGSTPSLLWLFHFDLHNWRELDKAYVYAEAARLGVPDEAALNWRYRVVARTVDAQLGRLLSGLEELGIADRTIVVFVSDHGEALGRHGFWVHGVFLWESLVHVPLVVRVPGVAPRVIDRPVGHVDLFPTLAPLIDESVSAEGTHGEPLWETVRADGRPRRFPLLLQSMRKEELLRIGLIDDRRRKLVLPLESGVPELYDLTAAEPDDTEVSRAERGSSLRMLSELVRSPVFPRPPPKRPSAE